MGLRVHVGARIPEEIDQELLKIATEQGLDKSDVIRDALKSYVEAIKSHRCPECGTVNDPDAKYCKACAKQLVFTESEDIDTLLEKLKADPDKLLSLLKQAAGDL